MQNYDAPLEHIHEDLLGRRIFAYKFAQAIINMDVGKEGFVAALTGPWGAGKSSTINFITHYIKQLRIGHFYQKLTGQDLVVDPEIDQIHKRYLPLESYVKNYDFHGKNLLLAPKEFVKDIIRLRLKSENEVEDVYQYMIASRLSEIHPENVVIKFSPWSHGTQSEIALSIMNEISYVIENHFEQNVADSVNAYTRELYKFATKAAASSIGLSTTLHPILDKIFQEKTKSISEKKADISSKLFHSTSKINKIVVVIDDLDRLTPKEAADLIQTIKGIGNIPRVFYLLSYDRNELSKLVNHSFKKLEHENFGEQFIEKIIQYSKEIPLAGHIDISNMFEETIAKLFRNNNVTDYETRLIYAWQNIISKYVKNPRDVKRLINSYSTALSAVHNVTDPIDLLVISSLEVFEHKSFLKLREMS